MCLHSLGKEKFDKLAGVCQSASNLLFLCGGSPHELPALSVRSFVCLDATTFYLKIPLRNFVIPIQEVGGADTFGMN